jgi:hypothetical protein
MCHDRGDEGETYQEQIREMIGHVKVGTENQIISDEHMKPKQRPTTEHGRQDRKKFPKSQG